MALDERADAVVTVDADEAETAFMPRAPLADASADQDGEGAGDARENGASSANGSGSGDDPVEAAIADASAPTERSVDRPSLVATNGAAHIEVAPGRVARKRTARQRTLLMAEGTATVIGPDAEAIGDDLALPVDPLLGTTGRRRPAAGSALLDSPTTGAMPVLPPSTTAAAAAAAALYAPAPSRTAPVPVVAPLPILAPAGDQTGVVESVPAAPTVTVVPPPPKPRRRARPRVRKVTRIVRSVDAWSVFKVAVVFFFAMGIVLMTASVLLWNLAQSTGTLDNVEGFFREAFNYDTFKLESEPLFRAALTLTALFVVAGTGLTVVMAVLFNLIADLTGGIRLTVLEREVIAREDQRTKRRRRKQPRAARPARPPVPPSPGPPDGMPPAPSVKA